jgi:hypothetical protein
LRRTGYAPERILRQNTKANGADWLSPPALVRGDQNNGLTGELFYGMMRLSGWASAAKTKYAEAFMLENLYFNVTHGF